ncbi:pseudouridylate synthase TRUB2, mitochondrial [Macrosteles quadrilineatus]|uniref:pseudouridylate synthase TRUB2, mitochondrial n=1 Tax=Macrosteles quadrilineatus TaxID=74068 RepID=UPI0023E0CBC6|nr:pseudouridylate synthase TRUB2, mitochondrial [Macrosteles quadrilineatus]
MPFSVNKSNRIIVKLTMPTKLIKDAPTLFRLLNGVVCVFKPSGIPEGAVKYSLLTKLCNELNQVECRPPKEIVTIAGDTTKEMRVTVSPSYADHPLVVGPRYQEKDFRCQWPLPLGVHTSGVLLLGLNQGVRIVRALEHAHQIRTFHVTGQLGRATDTYFTDGKVVERSKFKHVSRERMDKLLASIQAAHQRTMFELSGVDIQSQDAYELAVKGMIRPADPNVPMIYGIKCVEFNPPDFTLEIHSTNESEIYLKKLINAIGIKLHTAAVCSGLRCIRHSYFTVQNALLRKHWTLQHVIDNLQENDKLIRANPDRGNILLNKPQLPDPNDQQTLIA